MRKKIGMLVLALGVLCASWIPPVTADPADASHPQVRAFWVDAFHDGAKTPAQIDKLMHDCRLANINTLFVQVRRRGDAYYNLSFEPRTEDPDLPAGFDALHYLIQSAHASNIEVHAWLNTLVAWNSPTPPRDPGHVWNLHGPAAGETDTWVSFYRRYNSKTRAWSETLSPSYYLDPGNPDALDYTVAVYLNVVRNYDIDGIHLDYSRYAGPQWGYNPTSINRFNARFGRTGLPSPDDPVWCDWRREQTTALVRKVYLEAIAVKPGIKVSSATIAWGSGPAGEEAWRRSSAYTEVFQDWRGWLEEGILDLAVPMNYYREWVESQKAWYDQWIEWEKDHQYHRQIVAGPGIYMQYPEQSVEQVRRALTPSARGNRLAGVALYAYASSSLYASDDLSDPTKAPATKLPRQPHAYLPALNDVFYRMLSRGGGYPDPRGDTINSVFYESPAVFTAPAPVPEMPWKTRPTRGHILGVIKPATGRVYDHLRVTIEGPEVREVYADGHGWFGAADLVPGYYLITIGSDNLVDRRHIGVTVVPGRVSAADFRQIPFKSLPEYRREKLVIDYAAEAPDPFDETK